MAKAQLMRNQQELNYYQEFLSGKEAEEFYAQFDSSDSEDEMKDSDDELNNSVIGSEAAR